MNKPELLWQRHPPLLSHNCVVESCRSRRGRIRLQVAECIFEPDNPEGGDRGTIISPSGKKIEILRVLYDGGRTRLELEPSSEKWTEGMKLLQLVNEDRRLFHASHHSFSHVFTASIKKILCNKMIGKGKFYDWGSELILFGGAKLVSPYIIQEAMTLAKEEIQNNRRVQIEFTSRNKMISRCGSEFESIIPCHIDMCRIVTFVDSPLSSIPCSGVHVQELKEIGLPRIRSSREDGEDLVVEFEILQENTVISRVDKGDLL